MTNKLIQEHKKMIEYEASKHSQKVPYPSVLAEAYKLAHKAAESYNPDSGVKFSTHLTNQLKKLSRISTQYGGAIRLPENKQYKVHRLNNLELQLQEDLGREPTVQELADASGTNIKEINALLQNRQKEVNLSNLQYVPTFVEAKDNDDWMHMVYHDLSASDKVIFEHKTGFGNKPDLSNDELAKKLNVSPATISNRIKVISDLIQRNWK